MNDDLSLDEFFDARRKLLECQIERVKRLRAEGYSYGYIAKIIFGGTISREHLWLLCNPDKRDKLRERSRKMNAGGRYYDTKKKTKSNKKNIQKKKKLKELRGN